jgi:hypothetical protein
MTNDRLKKEQKKKAVIDSVTIAIRHILDIPDDGNKIIVHHKKLLLSQMIWMFTEADGLMTEGKRTNYKYKLTYISEDTKKKRDRLGEDSKEYIKGLRHEHVWIKNRLIKKLLDNPRHLDEILKNAIGCVVTKEEHTRLHKVDKEIDDWNRYIKAKIRVWNDRKKAWKLDYKDFN